MRKTRIKHQHKMSAKLRYHQAMSELVPNTLLHLFMHVASQKRYVPKAKRNEIVIKYLKTQQKLTKFATCKKDIKTLLAIGRKGTNLEQRLLHINALNLEFRSKLSSLDELYVLFSHLYDEYGIESRLDGCDEIAEQDVIYMPEEEIDNGFVDGKQVSALRMHAIIDKPNTLIDAIQKHGVYQAKLEQKNDDGTCHFNLYRNDMLS